MNTTIIASTIAVLGAGSLSYFAWMTTQIMAHAKLMATITAELASHIKADDEVHAEVDDIGLRVQDVRIEQERVKTELTVTNQAMLVAVQTAATAASTAAAAVAQTQARAGKTGPASM